MRIVVIFLLIFQLLHTTTAVAEMPSIPNLQGQFEMIRDYLAKCVKKSGRDLSGQILGSIAGKIDYIGNDCEKVHQLYPQQSFNEVKKIGEFVEKDQKKKMREALSLEIGNEALKMTFASYVFLSYQAKKPVKIDKLCLLIKNRNYKVVCTPGQMTTFEKEAKDLIAWLKKNNLPQYDTAEMTAILNSKIAKLNFDLDKIDIPADTKGFSLRPNYFDKPTPENKEAHKDYLSEYIGMAGSFPEKIMFTSEFQKASGGVKDLKKEDLIESKDITGKTIFKFKPYVDVDEKIVNSSVDGALLNLHTYIVDLNEKLKDKEGLSDSLDWMVMNNPVAVGDLLMRKPEYASLICESINSIEDDDKFRVRKDAIIRNSILVLGTALVITGVGAAIGGAVISASAVKAAAIIAAASAASTYGGYALSAGRVGFNIYSTKKIDNEMIEYRRSMMSGAGSVTFSKDLYDLNRDKEKYEKDTEETLKDVGKELAVKYSKVLKKGKSEVVKSKEGKLKEGKLKEAAKGIRAYDEHRGGITALQSSLFGKELSIHSKGEDFKGFYLYMQGEKAIVKVGDTIREVPIKDIEMSKEVAK